jgi:hypothetical protein
VTLGVGLSLLTLVLMPQAETRVATWQEDKKAAFMMMFDDNAPTQLKNVIPELRKRKLTGTFYVCPGKKPFFTPAWEKDVLAAGLEFGNHTMTHSGARDVANLEEELKGVNDVLARLLPGRKLPRLISFGTPGVPKGTWKVSDEELRQALAKVHLVDRGPGNPIAAVHVKTGAEMLAVVDKAVASGGSAYIIFHGVGGDWISTPTDEFLALLDGLVARRDRVWVADHISVHQYEMERRTAEVKVVRRADDALHLSLTCRADPDLYDQPLTLLTPAPPGWEACEVVQGARKSTVSAAGGILRYQAVPGREDIVLRRATK